LISAVVVKCNSAGGEIKTYKGKMHIILVVASGILTIAGMVLLWLRLQSVAVWSAFATFSLVSAILSAILIIISGIFATGKHRGILERIGVTPYQLYYFVLGLMVFLVN
jgi:ABC-type multidrug transport system permease subunit